MTFFKPVDDAVAVHDVHAQVDIETMNTTIDSPIITIGAVLFTPSETSSFEGLMRKSFYRVVDIEDAVRYSGGVSGATLKWWLGQDDKAIKRLLSPDACSLKRALIDLHQFFTDRGPKSPLNERYRHLPIPKICWAKSPDFDCKILAHAFGLFGLQWPFHFAYQRCVRTAVDLAFPDPDDRPDPAAGTVAHDARDDAINQSLMVQACYRKLGLGHDSAEFLP
jgi:exodeoxyribonuclease VIII